MRISTRQKLNRPLRSMGADFRAAAQTLPSKCRNCRKSSQGLAGQSASRRETWAGAHVDRPAGVRTPRASSSWAMAASVVFPLPLISAITVRVVALALVASSCRLDAASRAELSASHLGSLQGSLGPLADQGAFLSHGVPDRAPVCARGRGGCLRGRKVGDYSA